MHWFALPVRFLAWCDAWPPSFPLLSCHGAGATESSFFYATACSTYGLGVFQVRSDVGEACSQNHLSAAQMVSSRSLLRNTPGSRHDHHYMMVVKVSTFDVAARGYLLPKVPFWLARWSHHGPLHWPPSTHWKWPVLEPQSLLSPSWTATIILSFWRYHLALSKYLHLNAYFAAEHYWLRRDTWACEPRNSLPGADHDCASRVQASSSLGSSASICALGSWSSPASIVAPSCKGR